MELFKDLDFLRDSSFLQTNLINSVVKKENFPFPLTNTTLIDFDSLLSNDPLSHLENKYFRNLPTIKFPSEQKVWERKVSLEELYDLKHSEWNCTYDFVRNFKTGETIGIENSTKINETTKWKTSVRLEDFTLNNVNLFVPPGFEKGIMYESDRRTIKCLIDKNPNENIIELKNVVKDNIEFCLEDNEQSVVPIKRSESFNELQEICSYEQSPTLSNNDTVLNYVESISPNQIVMDFSEKVPEMAKKFPFELDNFQKQAILCLENQQSVFVSAHTSAGKTVIAEYAIALSQKHMTRVIYTSPIKSLSNQKFRDFKNEFGDTGLLTGDVQINPEGGCLIMTTEILRSMLYKGMDKVRDVEWVIFDEVHYINDAERGVVWEEVIIMLPEHINFILLSATVPNTKDFAEWIGRTKKKKIFVISTTYRPIPLEYYLFTGKGIERRPVTFDSSGPIHPSQKTNNLKCSIHQSLHKIMDGRKEFNDLGYETAKLALSPLQKNEQKGSNNPKSDKHMYTLLVKLLSKESLIPTVIFTFSKKRCELNALNVSSQDLTFSSEKNEIKRFFNNSISQLKGSDRNLPQVKRIETYLIKGIGVHHGGLLPILKEIVEILFSRGLIKVLFATETFAMGVNMPAKSVIFDSLSKHDGNGLRYLLTGEFIQMAGRAGRRGLDLTGTVIIMCKNNDMIEKVTLEAIMTGSPTKLESRFRLTYNMIINLLRTEALKVEEMMKKSFSEHSSQKDASIHEQEIRKSEKMLLSFRVHECLNCTDLECYYNSIQNIISLSKELNKKICNTNYEKVFIPGRVLVLTFQNTLACILKFLVLKSIPTIVVLKFQDQQNPNRFIPIPSVTIGSSSLNFEVSSVESTDILYITNHQIKIDADQILRTKKYNYEIEQTYSSLSKIVSTHRDGIKMITLKKYCKINDFYLNENLSQLNAEFDVLPNFKCLTCPSLIEHYSELSQRKNLENKMKALRYILSDQNLVLLPEYYIRIEVLKDMNYIDSNLIVQLKGRVACEINTCDEMLTTELIFNGVFSEMSPELIVSMLSCMVFQEKSKKTKFPPILSLEMEKILQVAESIAQKKIEFKLCSSKEEYLNTLNFSLIEVVYEWARGLPFATIKNLTDVQEGSIVRCIVRLDEACRDLRNASRVIGDPILFEKLLEASSKIKRDIVFATSLYVE